MLTDDQIEFFHREGYIILKDVLSDSEVKELRQACRDQDLAGSVFGKPVFTDALLNKKIVEPLKQLLGPNIVHFGEAAGRFQDRVVDSNSRHMHNDSRGDDYNFKKPYPLLRVGFYLQDHAKHSGGLKLRPRSLKRMCLERLNWRSLAMLLLKTKNPLILWMGRSINVASKPGDVVVWNLRTHHSGYALRVKGIPNVSLHPKIENFIPRWLHVNEQQSRCVIFSTYGAPSEYLDLFIDDRMKNKSMANFWENTDFSQPHILSKAKDAGVTVRLDYKDRPQAV